MDERVALVTGATSGIGEATVRRLRAEGFVVYGAGRRLDRLAALAGDGVVPLELDVTDERSRKVAVERIIAERGRIDVLVNNAGYGAAGAIEDTPLDDARRQLEVNVLGPMGLVRLVLPHMRKQGSGRIVNVSSVGGRITSLLGGWYHGSKFAMEALSDCLRVEVAPFGVQVSVIEPGAIATEWGSIAAEHVERTSGGGVYARDAQAVAKNLRAIGDRGNASPADVVADAILDAVTATRPRTRYAVGRNARAILLIRRMLTDRAYDRVARWAFV